MDNSPGRGRLVGPGLHLSRIESVPACWNQSHEANFGQISPTAAGSGTVLAAARGLGRRSLGIDLNPAYVEMARRRSSLLVSAVSRIAAEAPA
jgi:hypothetical protein